MREAERLPQPCRVTQTSRGLLGLQPACGSRGSQREAGPWDADTLTDTVSAGRVSPLAKGTGT